MGFVKSIPIRNSLALTKYQHVLREFCETNWIKKQPENRGVFETTQVAKLSTKSKRFGIGRVKNQNPSETIFMGFVENPELDHNMFQSVV